MNFSIAGQRVGSDIATRVGHPEVAIRSLYIDETGDVCDDYVSVKPARRQVTLYFSHCNVSATPAHLKRAYAGDDDIAIAQPYKRCAVDIRDFYVTAVALECFHIGITRHLHIEPGVSEISSCYNQQQSRMSWIASRLCLDGYRPVVTHRCCLNDIPVPTADGDAARSAADRDLASANKLDVSRLDRDLFDALRIRRRSGCGSLFGLSSFRWLGRLWGLHNVRRRRRRLLRRRCRRHEAQRQ